MKINKNQDFVTSFDSRPNALIKSLSINCINVAELDDDIVFFDICVSVRQFCNERKKGETKDLQKKNLEKSAK